MSYPTNILQQVTTYQESGLAFLQNLNCFIATANTKFENFQNVTANLGSSISFELPYRFTSTGGLVASFQGISQRIHTLVCDQSANVSYTSTNQERLFTLDKQGFMERIGKGAIAELSAKIEANVAKNANSSVPVVNAAGTPTGALHTESGPFRFFGDGKTAINSYQQLDQAITNFKDFGAPQTDIKVYLPNSVIPPIIGSGLSQFAPKRNDDIANSWEIGEFAGVKYYRSSLLPVHTAGLIGDGASTAVQTLTVVSTNDGTGANITQITCSCDASLSGATGVIKAGDLLQFVDGVSGKTNVRFLTFIGGNVSAQPVQIRATADANASTTTVVINITPGLTITPDGTSKVGINTNIVSGMKLLVAPSHRCGLIVGGNALYIAMPRLPEEVPFPTAAEYDKETGVSMRMYYGSLFGQNQRGMVHDAIWSSTLVPEYCMRMAFPL